jgi:hypothetical protein
MTTSQIKKVNEKELNLKEEKFVVTMILMGKPLVH